MMRILLITFIIPSPKALNGAAIVMHGQLAALSHRHQVTVVTFAAADGAQKRALDQLRASGCKVHVVGERWPTSIIRWKRHLEQILNQLRGRNFGTSPNFIDPRMQSLLNRLMDQQRFDMLQVENIGVGNYQYRAHIPSVITEHEVGRFLPGYGRSQQQDQLAIWRQFDRIQVFTPHDAAAIRAVAPELGDRVRINPFGIDIPKEADPRQEEPGTVVLVGGFKHFPNVDAALWLGKEIMPLLRRLRNGIRLIIVGDNPTIALRALACDDVIVTGHVPAIEPYLQRAEVVLAPMRLGGGMRVKVLQAMAMGKAVVTTPLAAEGLISRSDHLPLVIAETAGEIAEAAAALLASPEHRRALGSQARAFVAEYHTWTAYRQRLEAIYAELQQGRGGYQAMPQLRDAGSGVSGLRC